MLLTPHVKCYCSHDFRADNNILSVGHTIMIAKIQQIQIFRLKVFELAYTSERESSFNEMKHKPDEKRYEQSEGKKFKSNGKKTHAKD